MKTTLVVALALASLAITGCGDDGKSPKIKSFVASSQSLPEGGADVTFTWEVSRAKSVSLLPFPGLVTGSSATVNVTEPTTFTLLAKNDDGSARKKLSIAIGEPFTVTGTILTYLGQPASNQQVFVDEEIFVTDENGQFTAENVIPPYDVGVVSTEPGGPNFGGSALLVTVFHGVTRPDPRILCFYCSQPTGLSATVSGTVTGGVGFPYPTPTPDPAYSTSVVISGPEFGSRGTDAGTTGDFSVGIDWSGSTTIPVSVVTLQSQTIPSVLFTGFGRETDSITNGGISDVDPVLSPVSTMHITGSLDAPFTVTNSSVGGWADLGNPAVAPGGALLGFPLAYAERISVPDAVVATNESFSLAVPGIAGASYGAYAGVGGPEGTANRVYTAIPASVSTLDFEFPAISHLLTPVQGAHVDTGTVFSTSPVAGGTYQFQFYSSGVPFGVGGPDINITVYSNTSTIIFPDLGMLGSPADGRLFDWTTSTLVGFGSVDGIVEDAMIAPEDNFGGSFAYEQRTFTYSPSAAVGRPTAEIP